MKKKLSDLKNVGKAVLVDLSLLGIQAVEQLATCDPTVLYLQLERVTGRHQNICVWDVLAAIIHEARTGQGLPWWHWTPQRKEVTKNKQICSCVK